jgi:putative PIN family toxin of toxin-antitoxin system
MLRVVIDTSTLVSFVLTAGDITRQIISAWRADEFTLLTTPGTRAELRRVLEKPQIRFRSHASLNWFADDIERFSTHVPGKLDLAGVSRDPKDDMFLACAVEGEADYLVSSDRDLLVLQAYDDVCIVNPGEFLIVLRLAQRSPQELRTAFSANTLLHVWSSICLIPSLKEKVAEALGGFE